MFRSAHKVPQNFRPWTGNASKSLIGVPQTPRVMDLLDCAWIHAKNSSNEAANLPQAARSRLPADPAQGFMCNMSQSHARKPWGYGITAVTQRSLLYSYTDDFTLMAYHHLRLQGFPRGLCTEGLSEYALRSLSGEAFFLPSFASAMLGVYMEESAPWWRKE